MQKNITFVLQKSFWLFVQVLTDDRGLHYICATYERFYAVGTVLSNMVALLAEQPSARLLKHVVRCYHRLADNNKVVKKNHAFVL
jgi:CCR4-NOT transcription complex subunit 9